LGKISAEGLRSTEGRGTRSRAGLLFAERLQAVQTFPTALKIEGEEGMFIPSGVTRTPGDRKEVLGGKGEF